MPKSVLRYELDKVNPSIWKPVFPFLFSQIKWRVVEIELNVQDSYLACIGRELEESF